MKYLALPKQCLWVLLALSPLAKAADPAHEWLRKIDHAGQGVNYAGTFVYQHGNHLQTMRVIHRVNKGKVTERLVSLNGVAREIIRNDQEVRCFLPDQNSVVVEHRKIVGKSFLNILPAHLVDVDKNYTIELGKGGRVADRVVQAVIIKPKDHYRYGYQLWADKQTGLLLKATLVDDQDKTIEQFMFTEINFRKVISASELTPQNSGKNLVWYRGKGNSEKGSPLAKDKNKPMWSATALPPGFKLSARLTRQMPMRHNPVEHLVYSDGLAAVSVFIEKIENDPKGNIHGINRMGAVHTYGKVVDGHQVTVVGEVPATTVNMIGESVQPLK